MNEATKSRIGREELAALSRESLPFAGMLGVEVLSLDYGRAVMRMPFKADFLRPGGTISGPMMMGLADYALYAVVLSAIGQVELAVTTNLSINFLRKPGPAPLLAEGKLLKLGKRLAIGEVEMFSEGDPELVAHVVGTYSIPPDR
jgi:uncharacterized protein (TIGR00369 family)